MTPFKVVAELVAGDTFGPIAGDDRGLLTVVAVEHTKLRGAGGGVRNLWDVTDEHGRTWRTGGRRFADDCYGWKIVAATVGGKP